VYVRSGFFNYEFVKAIIAPDGYVMHVHVYDNKKTWLAYAKSMVQGSVNLDYIQNAKYV
jgi:uncharacterized protein (DUF2126 family)